MASALQAARIINLGMRLGGTLAGNEVGQRELTISPLPFQMIFEPGFVMTFDAGDFPVGGRLPRINIDLHVVTNTAESRGLRKLESRYDKDGNADKHKGSEDYNALFVPYGPLF